MLGGYSRSLELLTDGRYYQYLVGAQIDDSDRQRRRQGRLRPGQGEQRAARLVAATRRGERHARDHAVGNNLKASCTASRRTRIARELAEENVRNQQARYDVGLATTKDLIDFQDRLTQAERAEINALTRYNIALADLAVSAGHAAGGPQHRARAD